MNYREHLICEIGKLFFAIMEHTPFNTYDLYVYKWFLGERDGVVLFTQYGKEYTLNTENDYFFPSEMRTRDLRRLRNALARDYGKIMIREMCK